jgi:hypothetical protein
MPTVDLITLSADGKTVYMIMSEAGPWDGSTARFARIQDRANEYLAFALDGEMRLRYPESVGKQIHLRLDSDSPPDPASAQFLATLGAALRAHGVEFSVEVLAGVGGSG